MVHRHRSCMLVVCLAAQIVAEAAHPGRSGARRSCAAMKIRRLGKYAEARQSYRTPWRKRRSSVPHDLRSGGDPQQSGGAAFRLRQRCGSGVAVSARARHLRAGGRRRHENLANVLNNLAAIAAGAAASKKPATLTKELWSCWTKTGPTARGGSAAEQHGATSFAGRGV